MDEPTSRRRDGDLRLETPAALSSLALIRDFVTDACEQLRAPSDLAVDLVQAVDEAATNIILHGYRGLPGPLEITVGREGDRLTITLRDEAPPFDPASISPPDLNKRLEERSIGGYGIHLMRAFTDAITHRTLPGGGNELTLVKHLPPAPS